MEENSLFLDSNVCTLLIKLFNQYNTFHETFNKRILLKLTQVNNTAFLDLINIYKNKYIDKGYLANIEIVYWPKGESHQWHDDTPFYDYTTICYLNDNYAGGRTTVCLNEIEPSVGKLIGFPSFYPHKVSKLTFGERYVLVAWFKK
jgi:hypothetical protein